MEKAIIEVLKHLFVKRTIGGKHSPEQKILKYTTKWLNKKEKKEFEKEYKQLIQEEIILRLKKQTGKGTDWHISLNPRKIQEVEEMLQ